MDIGVFARGACFDEEGIVVILFRCGEEVRVVVGGGEWVWL
jgi:hypothetical protein